jgi:hypothetical protein
MTNPFKNRNYKYGTESFFSMYLNQYQFILGADLEDYSKSNGLFNKDNPCNIYFILRRPKITINPESFTSNKQKANFDFIIHQKDGYGVINLGIELKNASSKLELKTEYPYNFFTIRDSDKALLVARPSSMIDRVEVQNNIETDLLDYEILYIGQAYGRDGKRTALNRLASHETVQKIYTHSLTNNPDSDIWILLTNFSQVSLLFSLEADLINFTKENEKKDIKKGEEFINNKGLNFTEKQRINFTEAALIKYFEPAYNKEFKDTFPNKSHKSYSECYTLDVRAITIELDTSEMVRNIYTEKSGRKKSHYKMFEFNDDKDRISLLGISS